MSYACTHVSKKVCINHFKTGCEMSRTLIIADPCNIVADTLSEMLTKIGDRYGLTIDDLWFPADDDEESSDYLGFDRMENGIGHEPTKAEMTLWKKGGTTLYMADYSFCVERRETAPITRKELTASGLPFHD